MSDKRKRCPTPKRCGVCGSELELNRVFARPDSWVCVKAGCPAWRWDGEPAPKAEAPPAPKPELSGCEPWCRGDDHNHYCPKRAGRRCVRPCSICALAPEFQTLGPNEVIAPCGCRAERSGDGKLWSPVGHTCKPSPPANAEHHLHGCKAAGLLKGEPGYDRCTCPPAPVSEPSQPKSEPPIDWDAARDWAVRMAADPSNNHARAYLALKAQNADLQKDLVMMTQARDIIHADREECRAELDNLKAQNATQAQELERLEGIILLCGLPGWEGRLLVARKAIIAARAAREGAK